MTSLGVIALCLFGVVTTAHAFTASDAIVHPVPANVVYHSYFDVLALDVTLPSNNGQSDILQSFTVQNLGDLQPYEIKKLTLWRDDGAAGFQGMGIDDEVGVGVFNQESGAWYFDNLDVFVPTVGLRLFVSFETLSDFTPSSEKTVRLRVPKYFQLEKTGTFDPASKFDHGIYMESANDGPTDTYIENPYEIIVGKSQADEAPPKIAITNFYKGDLTPITMEEGQILLLVGEIRDQMSEGISSSHISVTTDKNARDYTLLSTERDEVTEIYSFQKFIDGLGVGHHYIYVKAEDGRENITESGPYEVIVEGTTQEAGSNSVVDLQKSTIEISRDILVYSGKDTPNDVVDVIVTLRDSNGNPVPNKDFKLNLQLEGTTGVYRSTDDNGQYYFPINADLFTPFGTLTFSVTVDDNELVQKPTVERVDGTLDGQLIKGESSSAVYLLKDNKRWVFAHQSIYLSYYNDFANVTTVSDSKLAEYQLGGNIKYRPGTLIKIPSIPKVYRVNANGVLNWIETESGAKKLYGDNWAGYVNDVSEAFFIEYTVGESIK